jgi:hypothetical protein
MPEFGEFDPIRSKLRRPKKRLLPGAAAEDEEDEEEEEEEEEESEEKAKGQCTVVDILTRVLLLTPLSSTRVLLLTPLSSTQDKAFWSLVGSLRCWHGKLALCRPWREIHQTFQQRFNICVKKSRMK